MLIRTLLVISLLLPAAPAGSLSFNTAFFGRTFTPAAFSFTDQTGVALNTLTTSNSVTLSGLGTRAATAVCTGCTLERNGSGTWAASIAGFRKGDTIRIRLTSSGSNGTAVTASVTVGAVTSSPWSVTTVSYTYSWYSGGWGACGLNSWTYSSTGGCSPSCGPGSQTVSYVCNAGWNTQSRTVYCQRSDSQQVDDSFCSGAGAKPGASQSCWQTSCAGGDPSYSQACNNGACVSCSAQSISVYIGAQGYCTDTVQAYTGPNGGTSWSYRSFRTVTPYGCAGGTGETPYYGTVSGGSYGTCYNYCATKADCVNGSWTNYGYTW